MVQHFYLHNKQTADLLLKTSIILFPYFLKIGTKYIITYTNIIQPPYNGIYVNIKIQNIPRDKNQNQKLTLSSDANTKRMMKQ